MTVYNVKVPGTGKWKGYTIEGGSAECTHENTTEGVDDEGQLEEPPYDSCVDCGARIH